MRGSFLKEADSERCLTLSRRDAREQKESIALAGLSARQIASALCR